MTSIFGRLLGLFGGKPKEPVKLVKHEPRYVRQAKPVVRELPDKDYSQAKEKAREIIFEARDEAFKLKKQAEDEVTKIRQETYQLQQQLQIKEGGLDRKLGALEEREKLLLLRQLEMYKKVVELDKIKQEQIAKLERAAGLTREEARKLILEAVESRSKEEIAKKIKEAEAFAKQEADEKTKEILVDSMLHGATDYVAEYSISTVKLTDEEVKGRIIGKDGRNIRALEQATGVDFDIDETPGEIRLSSFDSVRREIARVSLERLIKDGRIQPIRIEEIVDKTKKDIEKIIFEEGEKLAHSVGVYNLPPEILALLGRFKYRFSYGQNMIAHTLEETRIGIKLANEIRANVNIVRLGCLLHDIGKVITEEEGSHVDLGVNLLRKYNIPEEVIACVAQHHEDKPFTSIESTLVYIADAISGSRPGARYEDYGEYVKRLRELEEIAKSKKGVIDAYAFQAGRELRVIVKPDEVDDASVIKMGHDITKQIEEKIKNYPGQIKVTVIREFRAVAMAK
jgi:ribonucrease Y